MRSAFLKSFDTMHHFPQLTYLLCSQPAPLCAQIKLLFVSSKLARSKQEAQFPTSFYGRLRLWRGWFEGGLSACQIRPCPKYSDTFPLTLPLSSKKIDWGCAGDVTVVVLSLLSFEAPWLILTFSAYLTTCSSRFKKYS